jgi:hypothetical protein
MPIPDNAPFATLPEICSKRDLARLLDKSVRTVDRLQRARLLPEPLVPGRWSRRTIERWLDGGSVRLGRRA